MAWVYVVLCSRDCVGHREPLGQPGGDRGGERIAAAVHVRGVGAGCADLVDVVAVEEHIDCVRTGQAPAGDQNPPRAERLQLAGTP